MSEHDHSDNRSDRNKPQDQDDAAPDENESSQESATGAAGAGDYDKAPGEGEATDALTRAEAEVTRLTEALARNQAERVNHEKRLEREMDKARKFALERVMRDFVQVLDSLDQAIAATSAGADESRQGAAAENEGLALTRKLALKLLESHGLETIDPQGQPFDANWHEAMTAAPTEEAAPDTVLQVLQNGYALNGRLLRPARVVVAKAP